MSLQYTSWKNTEIDNEMNYQVNNFSQSLVEKFINDSQIRCNTVSNCLYNTQGLLLCGAIKKKN